MTVNWIPADSRTIAFEHALVDVMNIHDVTVRGGEVVIFRGQFLRSPELVYDHIVGAFKAHKAMPLLRQEGGRDIVVAYPAPAVGRRSRTRVHVALFVLTLLSTLMAGTLQAAPPAALEAATDLAGLGRLLAAHWTAGLPFTVALLGILGVHEFGHYFVARHYRLDVSLPYFIPFPLNPLTGTLGAVIRIQSPFESRKALFDVGIAGPLAGLAIAVPVVALGLLQAELVPLTAGAQVINEPLLFRWMALFFAPARAPGFDLEMNPLLMAGWWGFFITALNLTPISQLDGGHVLYGLFGPAHRVIARAMFAVAAAVTLLVNPSYLVMLILVYLMGIEHPPALNDLTPIGTPRKLLGCFALVLFGLLFTPNPFP